MTLQSLDAHAGAQRHRAGHGLQGGRPGDARAALGPHRQHHLAGLAHGAAGLHRLRRQQGRGRLDHPRRRRGARALWRAGQQPGAGHDGHRDAALDRGRSRPRSNGRDDLAGLPRRAHAAHAARPPRRDRRGRRGRRLARARCARLHDRRTAQHVAAASTRTEPTMLRQSASRRSPTSPRSKAPGHAACAATC